MKFTCQKCEKSFSLDEAPKLCPFCGSDKVGNKGRFTAEQLITDYNNLQVEMDKLQKQLDKLASEYIPIYLKSAKIRATLGVYKSRKVIKDPEMPKVKNSIIQCLVTKYPDLVNELRAKTNNTEDNE